MRHRAQTLKLLEHWGQPYISRRTPTLSAETKNKEGLRRVLTSTCYHRKHFNTFVRDRKLLEEYLQIPGWQRGTTNHNYEKAEKINWDVSSGQTKTKGLERVWSDTLWLTFKRLWPSPSSWMAVTSCYYSPVTSSAPNVAYRQVCDDMLKTSRKQLYKSSTSSVSLPVLEVMGRLSHDVDQHSRGTMKSQSWILRHEKRDESSQTTNEMH